MSTLLNTRSAFGSSFCNRFIGNLRFALFVHHQHRPAVTWSTCCIFSSSLSSRLPMFFIQPNTQNIWKSERGEDMQKYKQHNEVNSFRFYERNRIDFVDMSAVINPPKERETFVVNQQWKMKQKERKVQLATESCSSRADV